jgi:hypothetical protein
MAGNANSGSKNDKLIREALMVAAKRVHKGDPEGRIKLALAAEKVVEAAVEGDLASFQEMANRLDGRATEHKTTEVNVTFHDARKRLESKLDGIFKREPAQEPDRVIN